MQDDNLRRLMIWNRFWCALILLSALSWGLLTAHHKMCELRVRWGDDDGLRFSAMCDGPFVITHLQKLSQSNEGEKAVAELPQPIVIFDSHGAIIAKSELDKLVWLDIYGHKTTPPAAGAKISAIYYKPSRTVTE